MLYTVVPLERIYTDRTQSILDSGNNTDFKEDTKAAEYKDISIKHGSIRARMEGENYIIDGICSTDMSDYLNQDYALGKVINRK